MEKVYSILRKGHNRKEGGKKGSNSVGYERKCSTSKQHARKVKKGLKRTEK